MSILGIIANARRAREKEARKNVLLGLALGAIVGAAAGILLAPASGKKTREDLANATAGLPAKAKEFAELSKAKLEEVRAKLKETKESEEQAAAGQEPQS